MGVVIATSVSKACFYRQARYPGRSRSPPRCTSTILSPRCHRSLNEVPRRRSRGGIEALLATNACIRSGERLCEQVACQLGEPLAGLRPTVLNAKIRSPRHLPRRHVVDVDMLVSELLLRIAADTINNQLGVLKGIAFAFVNADNFAARALLWCPPVAS